MLLLPCDGNFRSTVASMVNVAKNSPPRRHDLPEADTVSTPGLSLRAVLELDCLQGATLLAGHGGLDRIVSRLNVMAVSYTHLRAHETDSYLVCRLLLEKKKNKNKNK